MSKIFEINGKLTVLFHGLKNSVRAGGDGK